MILGTESYWGICTAIGYAGKSESPYFNQANKPEEQSLVAFNAVIAVCPDFDGDNFQS
ncbi:MAG: hypothetical protein ABJQ85_00330 [Rhizobiaceae bacterium]